MASSKSPTTVSRRRPSVSTSSRAEAATEDEALDSIAKEAEARLAAKRAARAEARSIRMKEIERRQKETTTTTTENGNLLSDEDSGPEFSPEERSRSYTHSRTHLITTREYHSFSEPGDISMLKFQNHSTPLSSEYQISLLKDSIAEAEEKYTKAMVSVAQLDNERQAMKYHIDLLKDMIQELQEKIENTQDELHDKTREYNSLNRDLASTNSELKKCKHHLEERERILYENGINLDGSAREGYVSQAKCSMCSASLSDDIYTVADHRERGLLLTELTSLRAELDDLRQSTYVDSSRRELESVKRTSQNQISELKTQIQVLEQQNAQKQGLVVRLETQVKRYKQQADAAESVEDNLLADKRKLSRELRQCQEQVVELESEVEQLKKRMDKLKSRRGLDVS